MSPKRQLVFHGMEGLMKTKPVKFPKSKMHVVCVSVPVELWIQVKDFARGRHQELYKVVPHLLNAGLTVLEFGSTTKKK